VLSGCRPLELAECNDGSGDCEASVLRQHDPTGERSPWMPESSQMPLHVSRDDAHSPNDEQQSRGRSQKWQKPEKIPGEYGRCEEEGCCHWPGKYVQAQLGQCPS